VADSQHRLAIEITGDATKALEAIKEVKAELASLRDKTATVNVVTRGTGEAAKGLGAVQSAATGAARAQDAHARSAERAGQSMRSLGAEFARAERAAGEMAGSVERTGRAMASAGSSAERAGRGLATVERSAGRAAAGVRLFDAQAGDVVYNLDTATNSVTTAVAGFDSLAKGSTRAASGMRAGMSTALRPMHSVRDEFDQIMTKSFGAAAGMSEFGAQARRAGDSTGGSIPPIDRRGGALGGSGDGGDREGNSGGRMGGSFRLRGLKIPALAVGIAGLAGAAATAAAAGIGVGAVFLAFREAPQLMHGATQALQGFNGEFKKTRQETTNAGMPAMHALQDAAKGLGAEMAHVAATNIGTALMGGTNLLNEATAAVNRLEPAIGPAINGVASLGSALLRGVSSTGVVAGIEGVASALSDPRNMQGIANLTSGFITFGTTVAQAATDTLGFAGTVTGSTAVAQSGLMGGLAGAYAGFKLGGGPGAIAGGLLGLTTGGLAALDQSQGRSPTPGIIATLAGTVGGGLIGGPVGAVVGGALGAGAIQGAERLPGGAATQGLAEGAVIGGLLGGAAGFLVGGPLGAAGGAALGSAIGGGAGEAYATSQQTPPGSFPSGMSAPYGWVADQQGNLSPATSFNDPRGGPQSAPPPPSSSASQPPVANQLGAPAPGFAGFGTGARPIPPGLAADINAANQALRQTGPIAQQSMSQAGAASNTGGSAMQQHMQSMTQAVQTAAPAVQSAAAQIPPAVQRGVQSAPPSMAAPMQSMVRTAVQSAAPQAEAGGASMGASMTSGAGQGITKTETSVLTIIKKWITKIIDAGAAGLDAHSPSRVFARLGQSIPDGLAVGVEANAGKAVAATQRAMAQVVQGGTAQLGGGQGQLGRGLGAQLGSTRPFDLYRDGVNGANAYARANEDAGRSDDARRRRLELLGYSQQKTDQLVQQSDQNGNGRLGPEGRYSPATAERIRQRQLEREAIKQDRQQRRADAKDDAKYASMYGWDAAHQRRQQMGQDADSSIGQQVQQAQQDAQKQQELQSVFPLSDITSQALQQGQQIGQAIPQGMAQGVQQDQQAAVDAVVSMAGSQQDKLKKEWGINSPSRVAHEFGSDVVAGMAGGLGSGVDAASNAVRGVASDRGLQIGYTYGRSVVSGADEVLKKDLFQAISAPQIDSPQAKAALGALGLLGPAGSGASIWKSPMVTLGSSSGATTPKLNATINLVVDGQHLRVIAQDVVDVSMEGLADVIALQRG
jgi:hypothetical protein